MNTSSFIRHALLPATLWIALTSTNVQAMEPEQRHLTPGQREKVQAVSQAILAAKRNAEHSPESMAIREQIKRVKAHLDSFIAPVGPVKLTLASAGSSQGSAQAATSSLPEKARRRTQTRARRINRLQGAFRQLKIQCDDILDRRSGRGRGLMQRLRTLVLPQHRTAQRNQPVMTALSDAALMELSDLQQEIDAALALPEEERHAELAALSKRLTVSRIFPATIAEQGSDSETSRPTKIKTPTLSSRTSHRREF